MQLTRMIPCCIIGHVTCSGGKSAARAAEVDCAVARRYAAREPSPTLNGASGGEEGGEEGDEEEDNDEEDEEADGGGEKKGAVGCGERSTVTGTASIQLDKS